MRKEEKTESVMTWSKAENGTTTVTMIPPAMTNTFSPEIHETLSAFKFSNTAEVAPSRNVEETKTTEERKGFVFSTDDDAEDMGRGMVFSTDDDPLPEEEKKE